MTVTNNNFNTSSSYSISIQNQVNASRAGTAKGRQMQDLAVSAEKSSNFVKAYESSVESKSTGSIGSMVMAKLGYQWNLYKLNSNLKNIKTALNLYKAGVPLSDDIKSQLETAKGLIEGALKNNPHLLHRVPLYPHHPQTLHRWLYHQPNTKLRFTVAPSRCSRLINRDQYSRLINKDQYSSNIHRLKRIKIVKKWDLEKSFGRS